MDFDVNELLKKNSGIEPPTAAPTEPLPPPTVAKEPMTAAPAGPDINDIIAKNTGEVKPGIAPPGPESPGLLGQVPIGVKLGMRNAVVTAARAFDPGSVLSGMGIDPNSPENREALANAPATREERAKVAEKGMTEAMFPHGVPEAKGLGEQVVRGLAESWPTLAALALTGGFGAGGVLEEMAAPAVKYGVEVAPGLISKTAQTIGSAAIPFGIMGATDENPAAGALKGGILGATLGGMHLATKPIEKPLYQWLAKIGGGAAIGGGATAVAGGGAEEISRDAIIFGLFEALGMPEQKKNPNSIVDPATGARLYPSSPYPGLDLGNRINSLQGKVSDSVITILKDPNISTNSPEFIGAVQDVVKAFKPELTPGAEEAPVAPVEAQAPPAEAAPGAPPEAPVAPPEAPVETPVYQVKKTGAKGWTITGTDLQFTSEKAANDILAKINEIPPEAPPEATAKPQPPAIPTPEELAAMSMDEIKELADRLESAGINGTMFSLKPAKEGEPAPEPTKSAFARLLEMRQQAKPEEAPRVPGAMPMQAGIAAETLGTQKPQTPGVSATETPKGPAVYEEDGWHKIPGDDRVFATREEAETAAAKKVAPTPFTELLTGKKPEPAKVEPRTADELADAVVNFNEPPERSGRTPGLDKLMVELGQTAVPGLRMSDAPEAANMYLALKKGELTPATWDAYVEELKAQNRVKGYTPPEPPTQPVSTAAAATEVVATTPPKLTPEEARAAFMEKQGLNNFNFGTSKKQGPPTGLLTEGLAPGIDPEATGFQPASKEPGSLPTYARFPTEQLELAPKVFQHKRAADLETGVSAGGGSLANSPYSEADAGHLEAFETKDGKFLLAHGHNRLWAANRDAIKTVKVQVYREADGWTPEAVKMAAFKRNVTDGRLDALDIAQFLREIGGSEADLKGNINLRTKEAQNGIGLTGLSQRIWEDVYEGRWGRFGDDLAADKGAALGGPLRDNPAAQEAIYKRLMELQREGKEYSPAAIRNMAEAGRLSAVTQKSQGGLWGENEADVSLAIERGVLTDYLKGNLTTEKNALLATNRHQARLEAAGNVIKPEENKRIAAEAKEILGGFGKFKDIGGSETDNFLNRFAEELSNAKSQGEENAIKQRAVAEIYSALAADREAFTGQRSAAVRPESTESSGRAPGETVPAEKPGDSPEVKTAALKEEIAKQEKYLERQKKKMGDMTPPPIRAEVIGKLEAKIGALYDQLDALNPKTPSIFSLKPNEDGKPFIRRLIENKPDQAEIHRAIENTPGATLTDDGLGLTVTRFQKPDQAGERSVRTGVFYLPEAKSPYQKHYTTGKYGYGGPERFEGETVYQRPVFVKAGTGGRGPERAYDAIDGKGAYQKMRNAVLEEVLDQGFAPPRSFSDKVAVVGNLLRGFGGNPNVANEIVRHSTKGNTLAYAIQEHIVAARIRKEGYDSVISYSKHKGMERLAEVFDVREEAYPWEKQWANKYDEFYEGKPLPATLYSIKEDGQLGLFGGGRPLSKFEQRMNGIASQYDADPERVAQAMRATPKASDREIAGMAKMAPEEASKVVQGTMTTMARQKEKPGAVQSGLFGEPAPGGPGGLFAEPNAAPAPERSFAPPAKELPPAITGKPTEKAKPEAPVQSPDKEVANATERLTAPESKVGKRENRPGGVPEDGTGRNRQVEDFQSRIHQGLIGDGSDAENTFWGGLDLKPASDEFADSPVAKAIRDKARSRGIKEVIMVADAPFESVLVRDRGWDKSGKERTMVVSESVVRGTHTEIADHEFGHHALETGDPGMKKLKAQVNSESQEFKDYAETLNSVRKEAGLPPLTDDSMAAEIACDAASGLTRHRQGDGGEIDLRGVFHDFDQARTALVEYRGDEGLPGRMEQMTPQEQPRPPNYFKVGDKIINTRGGDGINRAAPGEVGVVRAVRVRRGTPDADGRIWLEVKWNKSGVDHNVVGDDVDLPKERAGATLRTQVAAAHSYQFKTRMENTGLSYLLDMNKPDALAEIAKLKEYWDGQKAAWENKPRSTGNMDYIAEGNKIRNWQLRLKEATSQINRYVKNEMPRDKDEFAHLKTAEEVAVGKKAIFKNQESLFSLSPDEERQGYVTGSEPMSQKEFEGELLKDRGALDKELRAPGSVLIPLYEGERYSGTRQGDKILDAKGRLVEMTPAELYQRIFKPTGPQLPQGTETARPENLLGKPGEATAPGVVEEPPSGYFGKLLRSVREKFSAANISEKADLAHSFIVKNLGWMAREMRKAVKVLEPFNDRFSKMTTDEMLKFTDMAESNSMAELTRMAFDPNSDFDVTMLGAASAWRRMADGLHFLRSHINESLQEDARAAGKPVPDLETAYWEQYFPRLFKNSEDAATKISALLKSRGRSLTGPESFENPRSQLLYSDSVKPVLEVKDGQAGRFDVVREKDGTVLDSFTDKAEAEKMVKEQGGLGLEPLDGNYINMMKANVWEQLRFLTGKYIEGDLKEAGFLSNKETTGWEKLKGDKTLEGYYAHPDVARVLDNFMSKGLRGDPLFELYNSPVTFINTVLVGLSAFHATFSVFSDLAHGVGSNLTRGIGAALTGRFSLAGHHMAELAKSAAVPLNLIQGGKFIEEYETPGTHTGEKYGETGTMGKIVDLMQKGGIRVNSEELSQVARSFSEVLRDDKIGLPRKVVEAIAWPIMSYMVPRIKINATARLLQMELDTAARDGVKLTEQQQVKLAQDVARKSDNIFGQMVYDNLSMTRGLRDAMRVLVGFPGWNIGSFTDILQAGKGIVHGVGEAGQAGAELLTGRKPTWEAMSRQNRMSLEFYLGTVLTMAVFGAITQRLLTGEWPGDAKDLLMPKTGALMANGQAERIRPPTYMRDVLSLSHPIEMAKHKLNFPLRMFSALTDNQDFFGEQIRDPYASAGKQVGQTAKYIGKSLLPFGIQGYLATESPQAKAMNLIGVTKVPRLYSNTPAMNVMDDYNKQNRAAMTSKQAGEEKRLKGELRKLAGEKDEKGFRLAAATAMKEGTLTHQQIKGIVDESKEPTPGLGRFKALPVEWQVRAWDAATPEEKTAWKPEFLKKVMAAKPEILIRNKEALVPVLQDMGLSKAAKMVEGLAISDKKASSLDLSALGIRKPGNKMSSDSVIDSALSDTIKDHLDKLGEDKTPKGFKRVSVKEKKRPYSALGF